MVVTDVDMDMTALVPTDLTEGHEQVTEPATEWAAGLAEFAPRGRRADDDDYALFERAIARRDDTAWATVYARYSDLVRHWLGPGWDNADEGVATTFVRFWRAMDAEKFARFTSVTAVLRYLKLCAQTTRLDDTRATRRRGREEPLDDTAHVMAAPDVLEETVLSRADRLAFWDAVQTCLTNRLEREVIYLSYVRGLCPREICARHGTQSPRVQDVYRIKRGALNRLRHAPDGLLVVSC